MTYTLKVIDAYLSVCKLMDVSEVDLKRKFTFLSTTDEEISLVCPTDGVPTNVTAREDGWRAFRIEGVLDFSLTGILSHMSEVLAKAGVGIFALSTYNTDYVLVKEENLERAMTALSEAGYEL